MSEPATFLTTQEYQRFAEFADAVRRDRYIGLCYGPPGRKDPVRPALRALGRRGQVSDPPTAAQHRRLHAPPTRGPGYRPHVFWTVAVTVTAAQISRSVLGWCEQVDGAIRRMPKGWRRPPGRGIFPHVELIVVDEADRLKTTGLEQLRDIYDHHRIGLVLIGMPGLQRRLSRYPQLYSRVGFAHEYRPLGRSELLDLLQHHASDLGLHLPAAALTDPDLAAIVRITGGNL